MAFGVEEYVVPKHGLGDRVPLGKWNKDTGEVTSHLGQVKKVAGKVPGPGIYLQHSEWTDARKQGSRRVYETTTGFGYQFPKNDWSKLNNLNKVPEPGKYEKGTVSKDTSMGASHVIKPRTVLGKCATGAKRSFLDHAVAAGQRTPGPGHYEKEKEMVGRPRNQLTGHVAGPVSFRAKDGKADAKKEVKKPTPGPGSYNINHAPTEERVPMWPSGKDKAKSFADRSAKAKAHVPSPDKYATVKLEKVSRGTKWSQLNGRARNALHGTY